MDLWGTRFLEKNKKIANSSKYVWQCTWRHISKRQIRFNWNQHKKKIPDDKKVLKNKFQFEKIVCPFYPETGQRAGERLERQEFFMREMNVRTYRTLSPTIHVYKGSHVLGISKSYRVRELGRVSRPWLRLSNREIAKRSLSSQAQGQIL